MGPVTVPKGQTGDANHDTRTVWVAINLFEGTRKCLSIITTNVLAETTILEVINL